MNFYYLCKQNYLDMEEIKGKTIVINKPSYAIYTALSDLRNITAGLPEQYREKVTVDSDTILAKVQNFEIGIKVNNRTPFSRIDFEQYGQCPFPFLLSIIMDPAGDTSTQFHIELRAQLNMVMRMMFGKKLQEVVDKLTDGIATAASGNIPPEWEEYAKQYGQGQF